MFSLNQLVEEEPQFQQHFIKVRQQFILALTPSYLQSLQLVGESIGIATLSDAVAQEVSDHLTFRVKEIMQVGRTSCA